MDWGCAHYEMSNMRGEDGRRAGDRDGQGDNPLSLLPELRAFPEDSRRVTFFEGIFLYIEKP